MHGPHSTYVKQSVHGNYDATKFQVAKNFATTFSHCPNRRPNEANMCAASVVFLTASLGSSGLRNSYSVLPVFWAHIHKKFKSIYIASFYKKKLTT